MSPRMPALHICPGSHRLTAARLGWERRMSVGPVSHRMPKFVKAPSASTPQSSLGSGCGRRGPSRFPRTRWWLRIRSASTRAARASARRCESKFGLMAGGARFSPPPRLFPGQPRLWGDAASYRGDLTTLSRRPASGGTAGARESAYHPSIRRLPRFRSACRWSYTRNDLTSFVIQRPPIGGNRSELNNVSVGKYYGNVTSP